MIAAGGRQRPLLEKEVLQDGALLQVGCPGLQQEVRRTASVRTVRCFQVFRCSLMQLLSKDSLLIHRDEGRNQAQQGFNPTVNKRSEDASTCYQSRQIL